MKVPRPPGSGKVIAEGKGVHREVESEGSRIAELRSAPMGKPLATEIAYKAADEGETAMKAKAR